MPLLALLITITNSYAYYLDSEGNIQSNNLANLDTLNNINAVNAYSYNVSGQVLTITQNASTSDPYIYFNDFITLNSGSYSIYYLVDTMEVQYLGLTTNNTTSIVHSIPYQNYSRITINQTTTFGFGFEGNGAINRQFNIRIMIYSDNSQLSYEPFGSWISQNNVDYNNSLLANMGLMQYLYYMQITNPVSQEDIEINGINEFTKEYLIDNQLISSSGVLNLNYFNTNALNPNYNPYKITFYFDSNIPLNLFNLAFQTYSSGTMTLIGNGTYIIQISSDILSYDSNLINDTSLTYIDEIVINFDSADALSNINFNSYSIVNYNNGYNYGYNIGDNVGYQRGYNEGNNVGYQRGYNEGIEQDFENTGFKTLITTILSYPVNMVRESLNFEFMGIHVASIVLFIVSLGIVAFVIKRFKD